MPRPLAGSKENSSTEQLVRRVAQPLPEILPQRCCRIKFGSFTSSPSGFYNKQILPQLLPASCGQASLSAPSEGALLRPPTDQNEAQLATPEKWNRSSPADIMEKIKLLQQQYEQSSEVIKKLTAAHEKSIVRAFQSLAADITGGLPVEIKHAASEAVLQGEHSSASVLLIQNITQAPSFVATDLGELENSLHFRSQDPQLQQIVKEAQRAREAASPRKIHGLTMLRSRARDIVEMLAFEYLFAFIIALNAILIGVETDLSITYEEKELSALDSVETVFLFFYTIEACLKLLAFGVRECFSDVWFRFDIFIILVGFVGKFLTLAGESEALAYWCKQLLLVRVCRLLRLVRVLRMIKIFKQMWTLLSTMLSAVELVLLSTFLYACAGVDLITKDPVLASHDDTAEIIATNFSSLLQTMLTLIQFVTMDSISGFYMPLIKRKPGLALYFLSAVLLISISLMNLITAALVEGALANAAKEKIGEDLHTKQKLKKFIPTMLNVFQQMDDDGSGELTIKEMQSVKVEDLPKEFLEKVSIENMQDLFEVLDTDGTGRLSKQEFIEGLTNITLMEVSLPTIQILKHVRTTEDKVRSLETELTDIQMHVQTMKGVLMSE